MKSPLSKSWPVPVVRTCFFFINEPNCPELYRVVNSHGEASAYVGAIFVGFFCLIHEIIEDLTDLTYSTYTRFWQEKINL